MSIPHHYIQQAKLIIRRAIVQQPLTFDELKERVRLAGVPYAPMATHQAVWGMIEKGDASWNTSWQLELPKTQRKK
jgi:hypothetical protein